MKDLEQKLRKAIVFGHPRTNRPWKKIILVVEGVYRLVCVLIRRIHWNDILHDNSEYEKEIRIDSLVGVLYFCMCLFSL